MEEKMSFILKVKEQGQSFAAVCRLFGVSRKTGYKWWQRYQADGLEGLAERSHRPIRSPRTTAPEWIGRAVALRLQHPSWGPRKLRVKLLAGYAGQDVPAASTLGEHLKRHGLVGSRRRGRALPGGSDPIVLTEASRPNQVWAVDFKGWFRTGDGRRCDPLTMSDLFSRYVVCCQVVGHQSYEAVRPVFEKVFAEYGLPEVIRVDNGSPFASTAAGRLSRLSVWWMTLGIEPQFITPGCPEQNGAHERMHRTLKAETTKPAEANVAAQQIRFEKWRQEFNHERPHEALGQQEPARYYRPSRRRYGKTKAVIEYGGDDQVRRVRSNGEIKWRGVKRYISQALVGQKIALRPVAEKRWTAWFGTRCLGELHDDESGGLRPAASILQTRQNKQKVLPISPV